MNGIALNYTNQHATTSRAKHRPVHKQACDSCTKSKVRCSLDKPSCSRCQSTGRHCTYATSASGHESQSPLPEEISAVVDPAFDSRPCQICRFPCLILLLLVVSPAAAQSGVHHYRAGFNPNNNQLMRADYMTNTEATIIDLTSSTNAEIRDRSLRPYLLPPPGREQTLKVYHPSTLRYISRIMSIYPRCMLKDGGIPPFVHFTLVMQGKGEGGGDKLPWALANCYSIVRIWEQAVPRSEEMVVNTLAKEMERLVLEVLIIIYCFL